MFPYVDVSCMNDLVLAYNLRNCIGVICCYDIEFWLTTGKDRHISRLFQRWLLFFSGAMTECGIFYMYSLVCHHKLVLLPNWLISRRQLNGVARDKGNRCQGCKLPFYKAYLLHQCYIATGITIHMVLLHGPACLFVINQSICNARKEQIPSEVNLTVKLLVGDSATCCVL